MGEEFLCGCEAGGGGELGVDAAAAEVGAGFLELLLRDGHDIAAARLDGEQHFRQTLRALDGEVRIVKDFAAVVFLDGDAALFHERAVERRATIRLHGDDARQAADFHEAKVQADDEAAVAGRDEDVLRHFAAELFVELVRKRFDALSEQRVVRRRCVVPARAEMLLDLGAGIHARAFHDLDLGAVRLELLARALGHALRHIDAAVHAGRRRIRRDRSTGVARGIERDLRDAERFRHADERRCAAVLVRARRLEILELQQHLDAARVHRHERGHHMADRDVLRHDVLRILVQAEQAAAAAADGMRIERVLFLAFFAVEIHVQTSSRAVRVRSYLFRKRFATRCRKSSQKIFSVAPCASSQIVVL